MDTQLQLTLFEQFDLDRRLLVIHHRRLGIPSGILSLRVLQTDCRVSLQLSGELLKSLRKNCDRLLHGAGREPESVRERRGGDCPPAPWPSVQHFRESMEAASRRAHDLRQNDLERSSYDQFGEDLCRCLKRFRLSPCYRRLQSQSPHHRRLEQLGLRLQATLGDRMLRRNCEAVAGRMLDFLSLIRYTDSLLHPEGNARQMALVLVNGYYRCRSLFVRLDDLKRFLPDAHPLAEFLAWSIPGLKMEASRAFRQELNRLDFDYENDEASFYERVVRALGVLQNAFEQIACSYFRLLDPCFEPHQLIGDPEEKYEEAVQLLSDLRQLQDLARSLETTGASQAHSAFQEALRTFREESFDALFRRDRIPFAEFESELRRSQGTALGPALHRFQVFLSVLQAQVQHRSVLHSPLGACLRSSDQVLDEAQPSLIGL